MYNWVLSLWCRTPTHLHRQTCDATYHRAHAHSPLLSDLRKISGPEPHSEAPYIPSAGDIRRPRCPCPVALTWQLTPFSNRRRYGARLKFLRPGISQPFKVAFLLPFPILVIRCTSCLQRLAEEAIRYRPHPATFWIFYADFYHKKKFTSSCDRGMIETLAVRLTKLWKAPWQFTNTISFLIFT